MNLSEVFIANIKILMKERGLNYAKLARLSKIHPQNVADYIKGVRTPGLTTIDKLATGLGVSPSTLLGTEAPLDGELSLESRLHGLSELVRHAENIASEGKLIAEKIRDVATGREIEKINFADRPPGVPGGSFEKAWEKTKDAARDERNNKLGLHISKASFPEDLNAKMSEIKADSDKLKTKLLGMISLLDLEYQQEIFEYVSIVSKGLKHRAGSTQLPHDDSERGVLFKKLFLDLTIDEVPVVFEFVRGIIEGESEYLADKEIEHGISTTAS